MLVSPYQVASADTELSDSKIDALYALIDYLKYETMLEVTLSVSHHWPHSGCVGM